MDIDRIREVSSEELALYFVREKMICVCGHPFIAYESPSGRRYISYKNAIRDCIDWLDTER